MSSERLNVIALISGGKDSFFSLLHCIKHGHRVVALANLFPGPGTTATATPPPPHLVSVSRASQQVAGALASLSLPPGLEIVDPATWSAREVNSHGGDGLESPAEDLNSFMYQTVGHEVLPLYAAATGLPLYRLPIRGGAVHHERDYDATGAQDTEETESMLPLLRAIMSRHPEANALSAGAILSTYQRTRVESIALRLGLVPLAYLWQYPVLPSPLDDATNAGASTETQLLTDMANAGLEARIIKVASAGLDEGHLWECVSSEEGAQRVKSALRKFGSAEFAAALGEGGEFETIVVDGPGDLFKRKIAVPEHGRKIVREGGGCSWLMLGGARLEEKPDAAQELAVRTPDLLDQRFKAIADGLRRLEPLTQEHSMQKSRSTLLRGDAGTTSADVDVLRWSVLSEPSSSERSIQDETTQVVGRIRALVSAASLDPSDITHTVIVLRRMSDFPKVNGEYGKLFPKPNPPSRVTISCGDLLPSGVNIAVYLTAPSSQAATSRNGLHVQSRSYWAPANIGPYSQAIDTPIVVRREESGLRTISIAGQIPLIPATMVLPATSGTSHEMQVILSLQHLWRIAQELKVQYWTSCVAYFPRSKSAVDMERNAQVAGLVWKQAHGSPEEEEESSGPDPWDLKYNPEYQTLAGNDAHDARRSVPDWSVLTLRQQNEPETCIPPMFAVEVEELPRQSDVEWHVHNGLSKVNEARLELTFGSEVGTSGFMVWHSVVKGENATVVYTSVSYSAEEHAGNQTMEEVETTMNSVYQESLRRLHPDGVEPPIRRPYLAYVDANKVECPWKLTESNLAGLAIIPCHSIWSSTGEKLKIVALYETAFNA
ncbi:hypothetical protein B0T10DRAFT_175411 [Thelonectria olida]|uniref:Diphthine--ammonia ligase n=1 Tax=Thelonectria olida TaxID=1576542 RepID=A0A9P8WEK1_9HYPO|nr:hypothetical protein B0T10DRAFT_175411 [Thelonectria olida]